MAVNRLDGQGIPERPETLAKPAGKRAEAGRTAGPEAAPREGDRLELSREARRIADLRKAADNLPEVREARVGRLREAVREGTYSVDSRELASAILRESDAIVGE